MQALRLMTFIYLNAPLRVLYLKTDVTCETNFTQIHATLIYRKSLFIIGYLIRTLEIIVLIERILKLIYPVGGVVLTQCRKTTA